VQRTINVHKLIRLALQESELTVEKETERAETYRAAYFAALPLGAELSVTDYQPADDFALLAAHAYINLWEDTEDEAWLLRTVVLLQFALSKSKQAYNLRLVLIAVYRLLGIFLLIVFPKQWI
jgi:N-terminal acetyltransferase B complex non-catalytic subunit